MGAKCAVLIACIFNITSILLVTRYLYLRFAAEQLVRSCPSLAAPAHQRMHAAHMSARGCKQQWRRSTRALPGCCRCLPLVLNRRG